MAKRPIVIGDFITTKVKKKEPGVLGWKLTETRGEVVAIHDQHVRMIDEETGNIYEILRQNISDHTPRERY